MRVSFAGYWLCGDKAEAIRDDPPAALISKSTTREQQVVGGPGWAAMQAHDRGNQWTTVSFRAQKVFDTVKEAEAYMLGYEAANHHPWTGSLAFVLNDADPEVSWMHSAILSPPSFSYIGCRVMATYTASGPGFSLPIEEDNYLWLALPASLVPSRDTTPAAGQAFAISGTSYIPQASLVTADSHWAISGTSWIPTGV